MIATAASMAAKALAAPLLANEMQSAERRLLNDRKVEFDSLPHLTSPKL